MQQLIEEIDQVGIDRTLIHEMYELNTIEDVAKFVSVYKKDGGKAGINGDEPGDAVQDQVDLIQQYNANGLKGYIMKTDNGTVFQTHLKKELCEQHLTTLLTRDLFKGALLDYTEVRKHFRTTIKFTIVDI